MKKLFVILLGVFALGAATPAQAQVKFGVKGGLNVTNMTFTKDIFDASNKTGFFIGPMVKVSLPLGFSVDAAALYDQKSADVKYEYTEAMYVDKTTDGSLQSPSGDVVCQKSSGVAKVKQQSINVPVNLRYAVGLGSMANMFFLQVHSGASISVIRIMTQVFLMVRKTITFSVSRTPTSALT